MAGVVALLAAGVFFFISPPKAFEQIKGFFGINGSHSGNSSSAGDKTDKRNPRPRNGPLDPRLSKNGIYQSQLTDDQFNKYLEMQSRKPEALAVGILLLNRWDLLDELKKHSDNVCALTVIACKAQSSSERLLWAERLVALTPENPMAYFIKAQALARLNRIGSARESLLAGLECGSPPTTRSDFYAEFENLDQVASRQSVNLDFMMGSEAWGGMLNSDCLAPLIEEKRLFQTDGPGDTSPQFDVKSASLFYQSASQILDVESNGLATLGFFGSAKRLFNDPALKDSISRQNPSLIGAMNDAKTGITLKVVERYKKLNEMPPEEVDAFADRVRDSGWPD